MLLIAIFAAVVSCSFHQKSLSQQEHSPFSRRFRLGSLDSPTLPTESILKTAENHRDSTSIRRSVYKQVGQTFLEASNNLSEKEILEMLSSLSYSQHNPLKRKTPDAGIDDRVFGQNSIDSSSPFEEADKKDKAYLQSPKSTSYDASPAIEKRKFFKAGPSKNSTLRQNP
jgi:hypothetical protein